jgi:undecaprenyl-diphosphatase
MEAMITSPRNRLVRALAWLGGHELGILLAVAGVAAGVWIFAELADQVIDGGTRAIDQKILLSLRRPGDLAPLGPLAVQEGARDITALGSVTILGLLTLSVSLYMALDGKRHMALFMLGSVGSGLIAGMILKDVFQRPRPHLVPYAAGVTGTSFPSGHSMMSALTFLALGALLARSQERRRLKAFFLLTAVLLTFLVGVTRVYLGVHWPSDVLAGWTAGAVWALLCWLAAKWLQRRHTIEQETEHEG